MLNKDHKDKVLKVSMPHCKTDIPLFVLFRAFGIESDKEILEYIMLLNTLKIRLSLQITFFFWFVSY